MLGLSVSMCSSFKKVARVQTQKLFRQLEKLAWISVVIVGMPLWFSLVFFIVLIPVNLLLLHSWAMLAVGLMTWLYLHLDNHINDKYFRLLNPKRTAGDKYFCWVVLFNRMVLLCLFMLFEGSLLAQWNLYTIESDSIFSFFWLAQVILLAKWAYSLKGLGGVLDRWPKIASTLFFIFVVMLAPMFMNWGGQLSQRYENWQDIAFAIMMAVLIVATVAIYDDIMKRLTHKYR